MVGDYISTSFANGTAHPVFMVANPKVGSVFDEAAYSPTSGLTIRGGNLTGNDPVVASAPLPAPILHKYQ